MGVAICGRPVARQLDDGYTLEVNRLCTDGTPNACSILYAAAYRAARAMGYNRVVTYILDTENGSSLKAAGYTCEGRAGGLEWNGAKAPKQADQYGRLRDEDVPEGLYRYDLRGSDYDPGQPITVEKTVVVNHAASVLVAEELDLGTEGRLELGEEGLNFTGAELTVREFIEEQQQKRNGLIHGDSDCITVEGHIGTWYAVDETEVGGEKFFLLEHEEHGDMAACVAVNEQGKLVAEDLWNGFDEDFQEAVKKYFSGKCLYEIVRPEFFAHIKEPASMTNMDRLFWTERSVWQRQHGREKTTPSLATS